jgi:hypothetical protein
VAEDWQLSEREKQRQVEERRVIYVGRIEEGTSKAELRRRFEVFGRIVDISVHFREHGYVSWDSGMVSALCCSENRDCFMTLISLSISFFHITYAVKS